VKIAEFLKDSFLKQGTDIDPIANPNHLATGNAIAMKLGSSIIVKRVDAVNSNGDREIQCDPKIDGKETWVVKHADVDIKDPPKGTELPKTVTRVIFLKDSFLKQNPNRPVDNAALDSGNAIKVNGGMALIVTELGEPQVANGHRKIKLSDPSVVNTTTTTWHVYAPHIALLRSLI
jgi:hypothetical protein